MLRSGKISVLPAVRRFRGKAWQEVQHASLREEPDQPADRARIDEVLKPWRFDLGRLPLYISIDRDVLRVEQAIVNWDSGHLVAGEVMAILQAFLDASAGLAGMDVVGDWSAVRVAGLLRRWLHWMEHPHLEIAPHQALAVNEQLNLALLDTLAALNRKERFGRTAKAA
jgi:hypothetical protein